MSKHKYMNAYAHTHTYIMGGRGGVGGGGDELICCLS